MFFANLSFNSCRFRQRLPRKRQREGRLRLLRHLRRTFERRRLLDGLSDPRRLRQACRLDRGPDLMRHDSERRGDIPRRVSVQL